MKKLSPSKVPGKKAGPNGSFPIGDPVHARLAIGGATRSERAGNISASTASKIKAQARAALKNDNDGDEGSSSGYASNNAEGNRASLHFANMGGK